MQLQPSAPFCVQGVPRQCPIVLVQGLVVRADPEDAAAMAARESLAVSVRSAERCVFGNFRSCFFFARATFVPATRSHLDMVLLNFRKAVQQFVK